MTSFVLRYDSGAMGVGHTIESERRKRFGRLMFCAVAVKLATDFNSDIYFGIQQGNSVALESMNNKVAQIFDVQSRIGVSRNKSAVNPKSHI